MLRKRWTDEDTRVYWEQREWQSVMRNCNVKDGNRTRRQTEGECADRLATEKGEFVRQYGHRQVVGNSPLVHTDEASDLQFLDSQFQLEFLRNVQIASTRTVIALLSKSKM